MHDQLSLDDLWLSFLAMIYSNVSKARRVAFSIGRTREVSFLSSLPYYKIPAAQGNIRGQKRKPNLVRFANQVIEPTTLPIMSLVIYLCYPANIEKAAFSRAEWYMQNYFLDPKALSFALYYQNYRCHWTLYMMIPLSVLLNMITLYMMIHPSAQVLLRKNFLVPSPPPAEQEPLAIVHNSVPRKSKNNRMRKKKRTQTKFCRTLFLAEWGTMVAERIKRQALYFIRPHSLLPLENKGGQRRKRFWRAKRI